MKTKRFRQILAPLTCIALSAVALGACSSGQSTTAAQNGSTWLSSKLTQQGYIPGKNGPDYGNTAQTAIAIQATGDSITASSVANYLSQNINAYVDGQGKVPSATNDDAEALAQLILVAHATKTEQEFSTPALVRRLLATQQTSGADAGLFGVSDPTYNGTYRESLALQALKTDKYSASNTVVVRALTWLKAQQCSGGGFSSDAANVACSGSPAAYGGPDTNSTAQAILGLAAFSGSAAPGSPIANALSYMSTNELADAGWGFFGASKDANSTALAIEALTAVGKSPTATSGSWARNGTSPMASLIKLQEQSGADQGGFNFQASMPPPSVIATEQAVTAASGVRLPL